MNINKNSNPGNLRKRNEQRFAEDEENEDFNEPRKNAVFISGDKDPADRELRNERNYDQYCRYSCYQMPPGPPCPPCPQIPVIPYCFQCVPYPFEQPCPPKPPESVAIIPFASGPAGALTFSTTGLVSTGTAVAFGNSVTGITLTGGSVNVNTFNDMAFEMPRDGIITSVAVYFAVSLPITLAHTVTIQAQLYASATPNEVFTPLGAAVTLAPSFNGLVIAGSGAFAVDTSQELHISAGTRLLLVFYAVTPMLFAATTSITGYCSGGLSIK
jgi:BclB C-terminal domain-containing protein